MSQIKSLPILLLVIFIICIAFSLLQCTKSESVGERFPAYKVQGPEAYGAPGIKVGNKYHLVLPIGTEDVIINKILIAEITKHKNEIVLLGGKSNKATEWMFFVYHKLDLFSKKEKVPGQDLADFSYRWTAKKGIELIAKN